MIIEHPNFKMCYTLEHPLAAHKLSMLRAKETNNKLFRELVYEASCMLAYEASRHLAIHTVSLNTPLETMNAPMLADKHPMIVPILRAGLGMLESFLMLIPTARVGYIGIYRDEANAEPQPYYFKIPPFHDKTVCFVCDPMLATGGTSVEAIKQLKKKGIRHFVFSCIIAAPEGVATLKKAHPEIPIYTLGIDRELNQNFYIQPGLGDAGDRLFGTE